MSRKVAVIGCGNAALCAAIASAEKGAQVTIIESASQDEFGGNSRYTAGALRFAYDDEADILEILEAGAVKDERIALSQFGAYPAKRFYEELVKAAENQGNATLQKILVEQSRPTVLWLTRHGVIFEPIYKRQAFLRDGKYVFWGGLTLAADGEGDGLVQKELAIAEKLGAQCLYATKAEELILSNGQIKGIVCRQGDRQVDIAADSVILACGGFEANTQLRVEHLGTGWDVAKVRGTKENQGQGIAMALAAGAKRCGNWGGCHAVFMDYHAPDYGNPAIPHLERKNYRKISYPFGIMLNAEGKRFVDEGADLRNYTYAKYGREVLRQPGQFAWQIFDAQVTDLLYEEYNQKDATKVTAQTLAELVKLLTGVDATAALQTLQEFNAATTEDIPFNPTIKDGKSAQGIQPPKLNWALPLTHPPFTAYKVTCGITFTYGGVAIDAWARVLDEEDTPIPGLFAAGEMVGDIFHHNYPGGSGLTSGSVFGKIAGTNAADL